MRLNVLEVNLPRPIDQFGVYEVCLDGLILDGIPHLISSTGPDCADKMPVSLSDFWASEAFEAQIASESFCLGTVSVANANRETVKW